jgi:hypothetical protein
LLAAFLEKHFRRWVNYDFTSEMEELLDSISRSQTSTNEALNPFWSHLCQDVAAVQDIEIPEVGRSTLSAVFCISCMSSLLRFCWICSQTTGARVGFEQAVSSGFSCEADV